LISNFRSGSAHSHQRTRISALASAHSHQRTRISALASAHSHQHSAHSHHRTGINALVTRRFFIDLVLIFRQKRGFRHSKHLEKKDPVLYPEEYRKRLCVNKKGNTENMNDPFDIGIIENIYRSKGGGEIKLEVRYLYRPENTQFSWDDVCRMDYNLLFWSEESQKILAENVEGKCFILPKDKILEQHPFVWTQKGNYRYLKKGFFTCVGTYVQRGSKFCVVVVVVLLLLLLADTLIKILHF
jgi:hypothetical protein